MGLRGAIRAAMATAVLAVPAGASAYDTGPHSDITRDALSAEGFGATAAEVAVVGNWFVDLYSNSSKIPQSGHASTGKEVLGSLFGPRENWPESLLDAANRLHFDASIWDVSDASKAEQEWDRLQRATAQLLRSIDAAGGANREIQVLMTIGMSLHALQDFYSHSTWIEQMGVTGVQGPNWAQYRFGSNPTWFDVPESTRDGLTVYIGDSTGHKDRPHGAWNTDGNATMVRGVNKDWPGRPGYDNSYIASYFATRQWVRAMKASLSNDALWARVVRYADRRNGELDHDIKFATKIGMMTGHWSGQGEPCDVSLALDVCGSRNGLGGDLIGARNALRDFFARRRSRFRDTFQALAPLMGQERPNGALLPIASARDMQASTRFVKLQVTSMKGVGLRALGDPTSADRADMFSRARIAGQSQQSGEINGRDSFSFPRPYAPFEFLKAIPNGATFGEPVREMLVEIKTSSSAWSGTDDDVRLRISPTLRFDLDKRLYDDFERGDRDTYSVPIDAATLDGLSVGDISRVQIEKSPDGVGGGWKLRGVKLTVNGRVAYERDHINRWLEDDHRTWRAPNFVRSAPTTQAVPITLDLYDEDSFVYGGNDHGDLHRYDRRKRLALVYPLGTSPPLQTAEGGSVHSGRLGDGDRARITYTLETLTPTPAALVPLPGRIEETPVVKPDEPKPPPPPGADLVITGLSWSEASQWHFTVTNRGAGAAGAFRVEVAGEGTFDFPGLDPGASATRTFQTTCKNKTYEAIADSLGQVAETDETNNRRTYESVCIT